MCSNSTQVGIDDGRDLWQFLHRSTGALYFVGWFPTRLDFPVVGGDHPAQASRGREVKTRDGGWMSAYRHGCWASSTGPATDCLGSAGLRTARWRAGGTSPIAGVNSLDARARPWP